MTTPRTTQPKKTTAASKAKPLPKAKIYDAAPYAPKRHAQREQFDIRAFKAEHAEDPKKFTAVDVAHWSVTTGLLVLVMAMIVWY
jgi:hypothetical protein